MLRIIAILLLGLPILSAGCQTLYQSRDRAEIMAPAVEPVTTPPAKSVEAPRAEIATANPVDPPPEPLTSKLVHFPERAAAKIGALPEKAVDAITPSDEWRQHHEAASFVIDAAVGTPINVAEAGGSTGGRLSDIRTLAKCFANAKVHPGVRLQVVPATRGIYLAALQEGLFETLYRAGANIFPASAGSNQAFNMGALAADEVMISTQARNFPGRNGHPKARHFLASPLTVAASALSGRIADPRTLL